MGKEKGDANSEGNSSQRLVTTRENRIKAEKWFSRARELGEKRQFDYAIEYYVNGLEFWPDAVEEALKALHGCGVARRSTGGKKPGLKDTMRRSMSDKDARKGFLNALWLFGHDPDNLSYIEGILRNASKLRAEDAAKWAAGVLTRALETAPKVSPKQFQQAISFMEALGDRAAERGETGFGVESFQAGIDVLNIWRRRAPKDQNIAVALKNLSTKLTILKGKYQDGDSYRDSIVDVDQAQELHDRDRSVQSDDRVDQLVASAEQAYRDDPDHPNALRNLVDLLCRREQESEEVKAIGYLVNQFKRTDNYRWKQRADDIRMKQLGRKVREALQKGDAEATKKHQVAQLRFELSVYKERVERYPTDNQMKYEYGVRCFRAGRFDDAIPLFQTARVNPKNRIACGLYLGRCFYRKGYYSQAVIALNEAIEAHGAADDQLAKDLCYWLGRAYEEGGQSEEARKTYGKILQMDYNFRDVRARLDGLPAA